MCVAYKSHTVKSFLIKSLFFPYESRIAARRDMGSLKGLIIITNNIREFERVEGLVSENWTD